MGTLKDFRKPLEDIDTLKNSSALTVDLGWRRSNKGKGTPIDLDEFSSRYQDAMDEYMDDLYSGRLGNNWQELWDNRPTPNDFVDFLYDKGFTIQLIVFDMLRMFHSLEYIDERRPLKNTQRTHLPFSQIPLNEPCLIEKRER